MATVEVHFPKLLEMVIPEGPVKTVEAETLTQALAAIVEAHPQLQAHLFDEGGGLREHLLCFVNGTNTRWLPQGELEMNTGDQLLFMQAVSGG